MSTKVKWTTSFPAHWDIVPAKRLFPESKTRAAEEDEQLSATQSYGVISQSEFMHLAGRKVVQLNTNQHLRKRVEIGDFVISMRSFQGGLERAWAAGGIRSSYVVLKPHPNLNIGYYQYFFKSTEYIQALQSTANFIRDGQDMSYQDFILIDLPLPPYNEQKIIAAFLNYEISRIDKLVAKQQQLIELLKEKRQAVISHAVTKGLNPDVPMKDSGVEWLGDVPKHWKCGYLRWYISVSSGTYLNNKDFETDESNDCINPVIGGNGVMGFTSKINDENCLIVGRVGALCGNVHQIRRACWVTDNALKISYGCDFDVDYLEMYLKVLDLNKLANHNAQPLITGTMIKEQVAIIPSIDEQKNITKFIQSKVGKIDLLIQKSSEAVDKIKERRTALISAAVTGKIDVRDWVAPDTQNAEELQEATA
ncbi:restriction endonuclease subunit S [Enterobacter hormaechei]